MGFRTRAITAGIICAAPGSGFAATASNSFTVGVTVAASCSFSIKTLLAQPDAAARLPANVCLPASVPQASPPPQPTVTVRRAPSGGVSVLTLEF